MVGDRSHLVGICDYDASEAQFVPQKIRNNFGGQIARRLVAYDLRYAQMAHHHKRRARLDTGGKGQKVAAFQFRLGLFQDGRSVVVVRDGAAVAGEVLEAGMLPVMTPTSDAQSCASVPNEREPMTEEAPADTSATGAKSMLKPMACRLPAMSCPA